MQQPETVVNEFLVTVNLLLEWTGHVVTIDLGRGVKKIF
jgi:hypothetical protein